MNAEVTDLIEESGRIVGVKAKTEQGELEVRADLVVGTDGRHSTVRERAGMKVQDFGVPIDVLWYRIPKSADDPTPSLGRIRNGKILVTIDRGDYFQCASIIRKGTFEEIQAAGSGGVPRRHRERRALPGGHRRRARQLGQGQAADRAGEPPPPTGTARACSASATPRTPCPPPAGSASTSRSRTPWPRPTSSPPSSGRGTSPRTTSARVQQRREMPVRRIQAGQVFVHRRMFGPHGKPFAFSWPARKLIALLAPLGRSVAARVVGLGFRPEHIETPDIQADATPRRRR